MNFHTPVNGFFITKTGFPKGFLWHPKESYETSLKRFVSHHGVRIAFSNAINAGMHFHTPIKPSLKKKRYLNRGHFFPTIQTADSEPEEKTDDQY
jgi:hypothetical protein